MLTLEPMWGGSGLHYAFNCPLAGDGTYEASVTVGVPTFGRDAKAKDLWSKPVTTRFHFKLAGGKLVEVTARARVEVIGRPADQKPKPEFIQPQRNTTS